MSHGRKQILQLDDRATSSPLRNKTAFVEDDDDDDDDDSMSDMPTPERLVEQDLPTFGQSAGTTQPRDIDDKVANFLAEIDALNPGDENSTSPPPPKVPVEREEVSPPHFPQSSPPARDISPPPPRTKPGAYSNMFVKGTPEFVKKKDEKKSEHENKVQLEPWPEEPKTEWQQLMDENTNYPYYWHTNTNDVVWDMPPEFSKFLILKKEYEEKVEKGLKDGTLDPSKRNENKDDKPKDKPAPSPKPRDRVSDVKQESTSRDKNRRPSHSEDSSSDSSDSDDDRRRKPKTDSTHEASSVAKHKDSDKDASSSKEKKRDSPDLPDSAGAETKKISPPKIETVAEESMDFDIDDIDKELEMALERKRQELISKEEMKKEKEKEKESDKDRSKDKDKRRKDDDRKSDRHRDRHRDDDRRKHSKHKDRDRDRDRDKERDRDKGKDKDRDRDRDKDREKDKKHKESEVEVPKLTLKERLKMEMELKLEKERKKKKALIEEMMAKELEKTVASSFTRGSMKRGRDDLDRDEPRKRYRDGGDGHRHDSRDRDDFRDYNRGMYDTWDRRGSYNDEYNPPLKPPPPTAEMLAYEEERRSEVVDYGHGRSRNYDKNGDSDPEDTRPADIRDIEMKKLEALQLAELALSKLEFLEVSKKGLSKLQILLIELETRHLDWQAGGLTTNHFLTKLREANRQLEQYEASAAPAGWVCSWDRDYRRYFYTHKLTGKTQWDYPDADDIKAEDAKAKAGKDKNKTELEPQVNSTNDRLQGYNVETDLTEEILASVSLPPPPPPPAEEHPSVKSLQLMYGSSSDSETEEQEKKKNVKSSKEEKPPSPPPPLPPLPKEEKHPEKEKKHKSKKKKKEKSKKKDQEQGPVGPVYTAPVGVSTVPEGYSEGMMTYDPTQTGEMAYSDPQALEAWYAAQGHTGGGVPVYGQVGGADTYSQNDQPLEFGTVPEAGEGGEPGASNAGHVDTMGLYHPPESYKAVPTVYTEPNGMGDVGQATTNEAHDGLNIEIGTLIPPNTEEKKKKKKEKMGSSNISLKKKHVSSMVQKWQKVKKEVELEERDREIREAEIRRKLAELD